METKKKLIRKIHLKLAYFLLPMISLLALIPGLAKYTINRILEKLARFDGQVENITIKSFGSELTIEGLSLRKEHVATPFISLDLLQVKIDRKMLLSGALDIELFISGVDLIISKDYNKKPMQETGTGFSFDDINVPVILTKTTINNVSFEYKDPMNTPALDIQVTDLQLLASNIPPGRITSNTLPTDIMLTAKLLEGELTAHVKADLSPEDPDFDINAEVRNINLVLLNDFLQEFGKFDVNRGTLSLFAEVAGKENKFTGYIKPEVFDLDIVGPEDANKNLANRVWQHVLGAAFFVFKNHIKNQIATKIPVSGTFKNPHTNFFVAIAEIFGNAFGKALKPSIDNEVNINSVDKVSG